MARGRSLTTWPPPTSCSASCRTELSSTPWGKQCWTVSSKPSQDQNRAQTWKANQTNRHPRICTDMKRNEERHSKNKIRAIWYRKQAWKAIQTNMTPALFQNEIRSMKIKFPSSYWWPKNRFLKWLRGSFNDEAQGFYVMRGTATFFSPTGYDILL